MTGFGVADGPVGGGMLHVEIRTVNHRHLSTQFKTPYAFQQHEASLRELLRAHIDRGHVTVSVRWAEEPPRESSVVVDVDRARDVVRALTELKTTLELEGQVDLAFVVRQPEVLSFTTGDVVPPPWPEVETVVHEAVQEVLASREQEGKILTSEVRRRVAAIGTGLEYVESRAPDRLHAERERLRTAVADLTGGAAVNEDRVAQEIAILADKLDLTEEVVRLRAHLDAATVTLDGDVPAGKRLGFLGQEMLREINTIGSKANDATIAHTVVDMKGELEKFREQIENLE